VNVTATVPGDVNLSGGVGFDDLVTLAQQYNQPSGRTWSTADFTGDGATNFADLVVLAHHYNQQATLTTLVSLGGESVASDWMLAQSLVPEPATAFVIIGGLDMVRRRRATKPGSRCATLAKARSASPKGGEALFFYRP
jgi:hypothetical protein